MSKALLTSLVALVTIAVPGPAAARSGDLTTSPRSAPPAKALGGWTPTRFDSCPAALHDRFATRGPDGRLYPGWHPPVVTNPATGRRCTLGHEHGRDPRRSDLYRWVARKLGGGIPFGAAAEALDAYAAANPGTPTRHEDHVGHKIEWQDDVELERLARDGQRRRIGVTCDFLTKIHQGSHSADAFASNVHELIYAVRCDDGTRLLTTTFVRFARPNAFTRGCQRAKTIAVPATLAFPAGRGRRLIPDRACVDRHVLVPAGRFSLFARGLYEDWVSSNRITTPTGRQLARWDPHFAVFNPARYFDPAEPGGLARTIDLCWERTADGRRAHGSACDLATAYGTRSSPLPFDDPHSPFDGSHRETYLNQTAVSNRHGPNRWYTDPYGRNASKRPFPGSLCQIVARTRTRHPNLESQAFGSERPYDRPSIHAPN
jgi:hypothetical protein